MQEEKMTIAKKILLDLAKYLNVKGIQGVADYFEEDKNKFYAWSKRGKIADTGVILGKCPEIRKQWLETGEGAMFQDKFQQVAAAAPGHAINEARANYPHLSAEMQNMAVTQVMRAATTEENELLFYYDVLCDDQKKALMGVIKAMAAGVPGKSPTSDQTDKNSAAKKSA